jgi:hypothetical protein
MCFTVLLRQRVFLNLFQRACNLVKTALLLSGAAHQQALGSIWRTMTEVWLDVEMLHQDVVADGVERVVTLADAQSLKAARRLVEFLERQPEYSPDFHEASQFASFADQHGTAIEGRCRVLWPERKEVPRAHALVRPDGHRTREATWT